MTAKVYVRLLWDDTKWPKGTIVVSTVSKSAKGIERGLSPFLLGPCKLYKSYRSLNMENGWQYAKVYDEFVQGSKVLPSYWRWAKEGWANPRAVRYPMGKGVRPLFSLWDGERLKYVEARRRIYVPLYAKAVVRTAAFEWLTDLHETSRRLVLLDYDAYDHRALGMSYDDVLDCESRKMGHAFVLAMLLTRHPLVEEYR